MYKFIFLLIATLVLNGCANKPSSNSPPLKVEKIRFDNNESIAIKQIVFEFSQNIAVLGAVPTREQIEAISISEDLHLQCNWRFINLNKLSCELKERLKYLTNYSIEIDTTFIALGHKLATQESVSLATNLPKFDVSFSGSYKKFPEKITIENYSITDISEASYNKGLRLKLPDGNYEKLTAKETFKYQRKELSLTPVSITKNLPEGMYEITLPKGFKASDSQVPLKNEAILSKFWFSKKFKFYGFACDDGGYLNRFTDVNLDIHGVVPCAPEKIALAFSMPLERINKMEPKQNVGWLFGPEYVASWLSREHTKFYQHLVLSGESNYSIDLSKIKSLTEDKIENPSIIQFRTPPATPMWRFEESFGTVVESEGTGLPTFLRRNVKKLHQEIHVMNTADELLQFLNLDLHSSTDHALEPVAGTTKFLGAQPINFRKYLNSASGLANVRLTGLSSKVFDNEKPALQSKSFMLKSVDYNLAVWHGKDLLLQAIDWQTAPVNGAYVQLVCEGFKSPLNLGITNEDGVAWLKADKWHKISTDTLNQECWIWTHKGNQLAAIKLPPFESHISEKVNAFAWAAQPIYQPNETVHLGFIARLRSDLGLIPLRALAGYHVSLKQPNGKEYQSIQMSDASAQGFSSASIKLPPDAPIGHYNISIKDVKTGASDSIGSFLVAEFTPPEFEYELDGPSKVYKNQHFKAKLRASRMNGAELKNASAKLSISVVREYNEPNSWPDEYEFNSWDDFDKNKNGSESIKSIDVSLNESGQYLFKSEKLKSTVPFGKIQLDSEVKSDHGETQSQRFETQYFSREHYIGTRYDSDKRKLHVIAIDQQGTELNDVSVKINVIQRHIRKGEEPKSLMECLLKTLPGVCDVTIDNKSISLEIESGIEKYNWYRDYNFGQKNEKTKLDLHEKFELTTQQKTVKVGDEVTFNLVSSVEGASSFILQAGDIQKVWKQRVEKGTNKIKLKVESKWLPYARIYASLSVARNKTHELIKNKLKNAKAQSKASMTTRMLGELLDDKRLLTSNALIKVNTKEPTPVVKMSLNSEEVTAGTNIRLSIEANVDSESQIWLVNEALLNLMQINDSNYDYQETLFSNDAFEQELKFDALSRHLTTDSILGEGDDIEKLSLMRSKVGSLSDGSLAFNMFSGDANGMGIEDSRLDFSQSMWLNTVKLSAHKPSIIDIKLPQLIGRWKVLALTATNQTMSIDSTSISTTRDVEYFLDAPTSIIEGDKADFAISQINRAEAPISDLLYLWIDDKKVSSIDIALTPNGYKRINTALPILKPGNYTLKLTSKSQPDFAAISILHVMPARVLVENTWLVKKGEPNVIQRPQAYVPDSLQVSAMLAGQQTPNWQSLATYNKTYSHQCWEQTISRAVVHQFNPESENEWPSGKDQLNNLISKKQKYIGYMGLFSYFPNMSQDTFLTAYTYLVSSWLKNTTTPLDIDKQATKNILLDFIEGNDYSNFLDSTPLAKSMALLALAVNRDIPLQKVLTIRQSLGHSDTQSAVLQALALKELGAEPSLYDEVLESIGKGKYIDENQSVFNQSAEKCMAVLTYEPKSPESAALISEIILKQQEQGNFGSTFSNAICSYALKDSKAKGSSFQLTNYVDENGTLSYQRTNNETHWVKLNYDKNMTDVTPEALGINLHRTLFVNRNKGWHKVVQSEPLKVGDLLKTTISIESPKAREHIAITDSVAGGFEAINPELGNKLYIENLGLDWPNTNRIEIRDGKAYWYIRHLDKGEREITYYSRVMHSGTYTVAPANAEAMYRTDVKSNTDAMHVMVEQ